MNTTNRLACLAAALVVCTAGARAAHVKLFVLTGQSNSLGTTNGGESDPSSGSDPADSSIRFFWHNVQNASTTIGTSGGVVTTLQDQQGGIYTGSATHWGPEMAFGRTLYRAGVRDFGIVKASRGGGGNTNWHKASGGHMYAHVTSTVYQAVADLTASGHTSEVTGFLYLQGESDSGTEAAIADTRLSQLITNLRADLPNAAGMHAVIGGIAAATANDDMVRAKHASLAAGDATIDYFDNVDLRGHLYDNLHFDKESKFTVGQRYAYAFFDAGVVTRDYGNLVFIGDSITQGGNGHPSYRYEVFKHLATNDATCAFVGSVTGAYANNAGATPDYAGHTFTNHHDGHWGWRAMWECGRMPLPTGRHSNNRGEGTVRCWTGQTNRYESGTVGNWVNYPVPFAGSGCTGTTYVPDTAAIMIGINESTMSSTTQLLADAGLMVDQLQAASPAVTVYMMSLLPVGTGHGSVATINPTVDVYNVALSINAPTWSTASSTVFYASVTNGFNADTMTYDNVHPNAAGEVHIGERLAAAMGLAVVEPEPPESSVLRWRDSTAFASSFAGNDIYNGAAYVNGWADDDITEALIGDGSVNISNTTTSSDAYLAGTASSSSGTLWTDGNAGDWTFEIKLRFNSVANGFGLWLGVGTDLVLPEIYADYTDIAGVDVFHDSNMDGEYHVYRVAHDSAANVYHLWRDSARLSPAGGATYDSTLNENRMLLGDYTSGDFGDGFDVDIAYVRYDQTGAYPPEKVLPGRNVVRFTGGRDHLFALPDGSGPFDGPLGSAWTDPVPGDSKVLFNGGGSSIRASDPDWNPAGSWTVELRLKVTADGGTASGQATDGFVIWADNGSSGDHSGLLRVRAAGTVWGYNNAVYEGSSATLELLPDDNSAARHVYRLAYDAAEERFWVWRDDVLIGDYLEAVNAQANDFAFFGSYTASVTATAEVDYLAYDTTGAFAPSTDMGTVIFLR